MQNPIKAISEKLHVNSVLKAQWAVNVKTPQKILRMHKKKLKHYFPKLSEVGEDHYKLFFENLDKVDVEHRFGRLIAQRQNDLFQSILLLLGYNYCITAIPLMRALCDTLFLLKYVEIHPEYIKRFMDKQEGGVRIYQIKQEISDQNLIDYYNFLSRLMHSNSESIKLNYYPSKNKKKALITLQPAKNDELIESHIFSLIGILIESQKIINDIYSKSWKREKGQK